MRKYFSLLILLSFGLHIFSQESHSNIEGEWMLADLDNSIVSFYKGTDGFVYSKIVKSDKAIYVSQVIFKGKLTDDKKHWEGTFTTPKSKMNIATKIYLDSKDHMRFVGKKYFITKTYIGKRIK
jgi:hypothetical protein